LNFQSIIDRDYKMAVYVGARDLAGFAIIGTHQYLVIVPDNQNLRPVISPLSQQKMKIVELGKGEKGFTVAGHQVSGRLQVIVNEKSDLAAVNEFFTKDRGIPDWDAELRKIKHKSTDTDFIIKIIELTANYIINERKKNIPYSPFNNNCNKWAQSVIEYAGGTVNGDFPGLDLNNDGRFQKKFFESAKP